MRRFWENHRYSLYLRLGLQHLSRLCFRAMSFQINAGQWTFRMSPLSTLVNVMFNSEKPDSRSYHFTIGYGRFCLGGLSRSWMTQGLLSMLFEERDSRRNMSIEGRFFAAFIRST